MFRDLHGGNLSPRMNPCIGSTAWFKPNFTLANPPQNLFHGLFYSDHVRLYLPPFIMGSFVFNFKQYILQTVTTLKSKWQPNYLKKKAYWKETTKVGKLSNRANHLDFVHHLPDLAGVSANSHIRLFTVLKKNQGWNASDPIFGSVIRILVNIHFSDR